MKKLFSLLVVTGFAVSMPFFASAATLSTPLNVGTSFPNLGSSNTISGSCGTTGANSPVSFALVQNGTTTILPVSNNLTATSNGSFNGSVTFPTSFAAGPATLVATCTTTGDVINSSPITFPAAASTSFTLGSGSPTMGGTFTLSGACGGSNGTGTAQLNLNSNGSTTSLGSVNLGPTGTFNGPIVIPTTANAGSATVTATCSNGTTFSSPITIGNAAVNNFVTNTSPTLGSSGAVSGSCGTTSGNTNGLASFSLLRNGTMTPLTATGTSTNANGMFNGSVTFPTSFSSGPATLVVTCPAGGTFTSQLNLIDPATTPGLTVPGTGALLTDPSATGGVAGVDGSATPVGGVNAGSAPEHRALNALIALSLIAFGFGGVYLTSRRGSFMQ